MNSPTERHDVSYVSQDLTLTQPLAEPRPHSGMGWDEMERDGIVLNPLRLSYPLSADFQSIVSRRLWPSEKACSECWSGLPSVNDDPPWSENEVLNVLRKTFSCPEPVGEGSWAVNCVLVCAGAAVLVWVRRWVEMRGIGLSKKRVDAGPSL